MPRASDGTYTAPTTSMYPAVTNSVINPADQNTLVADFISVFGTDSLDRTGKGAMQANLDLGTHAIVGVTSLGMSGTLAFAATGILQEKVTALMLANGANNDITLTTGIFFRIAGPNAGFATSGFTAGADGRVIRIFNPIAQNWTITNDATSTAANRILTCTGADVVTTGAGFASFIYSADDSRWILMSVQT